MTISRAVLLAALAAAGAPAAAVDPNFQDGLWRVDVVTEMRGRGPKPAPPHRYQACLTRRDITERLTPPAGPCRAVVTDAREEEMSWRLQCLPAVGEIDGRIHMKFLGDRMEGTVVTRTVFPDPLEVTQRISARRLGECKDAPRQAQRGSGAQPRLLRDYESK